MSAHLAAGLPLLIVAQTAAAGCWLLPQPAAAGCCLVPGALLPTSSSNTPGSCRNTATVSKICLCHAGVVA